jgi:hypothetical protein
VLGGYVGAAHHTWNRDFRETMPGGYREEYTWNYFPVGIQAGFTVRDLAVRLDAAWLLTAPGTNHAYLSDVSSMYADVDLPIANGGGARLHVLASYPITGALSVLGLFSIENDVAVTGPGVPFTFKDGTPVMDSNGNPLYASYPGASTTRIAVMAGASYGF